MMNWNDEIKEYHDRKVTLSQPQQDEMSDIRSRVKDRIKAWFRDQGKELPCRFETQGSYAMRTMIQDSNSDFDIDYGVYFSSESVSDDPESVRKDVLQSTKHGAYDKEPIDKRVCVRLFYKKGYHVDIPVYRDDSTNCNDELVELSAGAEWKKSAPSKLNSWFSERVPGLNRGAVDKCQLRRVVRLTKKFSRSREGWRGRMPSGICITKLVVDAFEEDPGREDRALRTCWDRIRSTLMSRLEVDNPVIDGLLSGKDPDTELEFLKQKLSWSLQEMEVLDEDDASDKDAIRICNRVFNTDYFNRYEPDENKKDGSGGPYSDGNKPDFDGPQKRRDSGEHYGER